MKRKLSSLAGAIALIVAAIVSHAVADDSDETEFCSNGSAVGQMSAHLRLSDHMTMTEARAATPADTERGEKIIATMRAKLGKYEDYKGAMAEGYGPYMESVPQDG